MTRVGRAAPPLREGMGKKITVTEELSRYLQGGRAEVRAGPGAFKGGRISGKVVADDYVKTGKVTVEVDEARYLALTTSRA